MSNKKYTLWTYDFTIITLGSVISMVGASLSGFAISLVVLDNTGSTFLYTLFNVSFQIPMLICPVLAGPFLDRHSRKKVIYTLDFASSAIFFVLFLLLQSGWFNYPIMMVCCMVIGAIQGTYNVAYNSFYPNLITEGFFRQAYSVSSMLWPLAAMSTPVAAAIYDSVGAAPIFAINSCCFFLAACFERKIRHKETHISNEPAPKGSMILKQFGADFKEGFNYIKSEKGLLYMSLYFMVSETCYAVDNLQLPFFKNHPENFAMWPVAVATLFAIVSNCSVVGRFAGGFIQYKVPIPSDKKFNIAMTVYIINFLISGFLLFLPIPLMAVGFFMQGILGVTSYTIRTAATQAYVPDNKRARFNGVFGMMTSVGCICGNLTAGALGEALPERGVVLGVNMIGLFLVYVFIYRGREHIKKVYNQDV